MNQAFAWPRNRKINGPGGTPSRAALSRRRGPSVWTGQLRMPSRPANPSGKVHNLNNLRDYEAVRRLFTHG
jgi:hypothetical protein